MNLNIANLKVGLAASTDATRPNLCTIHITPEGTEAMDGHILAKVSLPRQFEPDHVPSVIKTVEAEYLEPFLVPAKTLMTLKPFKSKTLPVLDSTIFIDIEKTNANGSAQFGMSNLDVTLTPAIQKIDAEFPDTERVIPNGKPVRTVYFDADLMVRLLNIAQAADATTIRMDMKDDQVSPIKLTSENEVTAQTFTGVLLPLKNHKEETMGVTQYRTVAYVQHTDKEFLDMPLINFDEIRDAYYEMAEATRPLFMNDVMAELKDFHGDVKFCEC